MKQSPKKKQLTLVGVAQSKRTAFVAVQVLKVLMRAHFGNSESGFVLSVLSGLLTFCLPLPYRELQKKGESLLDWSLIGLPVATYWKKKKI